MAVVVPKDEVAALRALPGVAAVWPNVTYHALAVKTGVQQIGADKLWGADLSTAGEGIKIGIIDDGLDAAHPYFNPTGFQYPPGFPKGQTKYATPKVIVQRTFTPAASTYKNAALPFDPTQSFHATHVAGIAAGDYATGVNGTTQISGVAPRAYLGNYKALTQPTPGFGLDGNRRPPAPASCRSSRPATTSTSSATAPSPRRATRRTRSPSRPSPRAARSRTSPPPAPHRCRSA
jgi:subtilisin family serine protease